MLKRVQNLDIFRKAPQDLIEPTYSGATISLICMLLITFLSITELIEFNSLSVSSEMFIDINRGANMTINVNISFPHLPCELLSLDIQDVMGTHTINVDGKLIKRRILNGTIVGEEIHQNNIDNIQNGQFVDVDIERARLALQNQEGCDLIGFLIVKKVPGNFHISSHPYEQYLPRILNYVGASTIDLSHRINHMSFGEQDDLAHIREHFQDSGVLNPLDGLERMKNKELKHTGVVHQYYISIVPTTYVDIQDKQYYVSQFSANSNEVQTQYMPVVYFRYDFSPVTVKYIQYKEEFLHFIVQICAIVGGVFTIAGILDSLVHSGVKKIYEQKLK